MNLRSFGALCAASFLACGCGTTPSTGVTAVPSPDKGDSGEGPLTSLVDGGSMDGAYAADDAGEIGEASVLRDAGVLWDAGTNDAAIEDSGVHDADAVRDAGLDGGADSGGSEEALGGISAVSNGTTVDGGLHGAYRAGAYFVRRPRTTPSSTRQTIGPCVVETLDANDPQVPEQIVSAGAITITGGTLPLNLVPLASGDYNSVHAATSLLWNGGETLTATASGSGVPGFSVSLVAPSKLTITAPTLPTSASLMVPRRRPLSVVWTGASSGNVIVYLDVVAASTAYTLTCTYAPSDGSGEVPSAALSLLPAGAGTFDLYVLERVAAVVPAWSINFVATSSMQNSAGRAGLGQVTLQ